MRRVNVGMAVYWGWDVLCEEGWTGTCVSYDGLAELPTSTNKHTGARIMSRHTLIMIIIMLAGDWAIRRISLAYISYTSSRAENYHFFVWVCWRWESAHAPLFSINFYQSLPVFILSAPVLHLSSISDFHLCLHLKSDCFTFYNGPELKYLSLKLI